MVGLGKNGAKLIWKAVWPGVVVHTCSPSTQEKKGKHSSFLPSVLCDVGGLVLWDSCCDSKVPHPWKTLHTQTFRKHEQSFSHPAEVTVERRTSGCPKRLHFLSTMNSAGTSHPVSRQLLAPLGF